MDMRLRIPELLTEKGVNAYRLATRSNGRISLSTAYRLKRDRGYLQTYSAKMLEAMVDIFGVTASELFEDERAKQ
jgi:transcriptional regulator with XRE-family HTH domain